MNDLMIQMLDQFEAGLMDRALKVMHVVMDEKYPRDEVIEWYHKNWQRTVI